MKRFVIGSAIGVVTVLMSASGALAHTEFQPSGATAGKTVDFKLFVEDEKSDAVTSKVELFLPADGSVSVSAAPETGGMKVAIESTKSVTWTGNTTDGNVLLSVSLVIPAQEGRLQFKVLQTYDNGTIDRWLGLNPTSGTVSPNPGPIIDVAASGTTVTTTADGGEHHGSETTTVQDGRGDHHGGSETSMDHGLGTTMDHGGGEATTTTSGPAKNKDDSNSGTIIGIVLAVVALGGGGAALAMRARKKP